MFPRVNRRIAFWSPWQPLVDYSLRFINFFYFNETKLCSRVAELLCAKKQLNTHISIIYEILNIKTLKRCSCSFTRYGRTRMENICISDLIPVKRFALNKSRVMRGCEPRTHLFCVLTARSPILQRSKEI